MLLLVETKLFNFVPPLSSSIVHVDLGQWQGSIEIPPISVEDLMIFSLGECLLVVGNAAPRGGGGGLEYLPDI